MALPSSAKVCVVGGGIIGTSIAYHLAAQGCRDVVLLERDKVTSGTTWHAAGLICCYGSLSETSTQMRIYAKRLYQDLEKETGQETGFRPCGFIELASNKDRLAEFRRVAAFNRRMGVDVNEISPKEVQDKFPLAKVDDVHAGFYIPDDGRINPVDVTMAMTKGAKLRGVKIFEDTPVDTVTRQGSRVTGVTTASGHTIQCESVVNCCGMWARQFAAKAGVNTVTNAPAEHYYLLTDEIEGISKDWPVIEDPSHYGYYREERGGMLVGLFEPVAAAWNVKGVPSDSSFTTIEPDWPRMEPFLDKAMSRVPITKTTGIRKFFCGPESFTPDLSPLVGESTQLRNYFVCAGLNSIGILSGGGWGRIMAHWVLNGKPDVDVTAMNITRVPPHWCSDAFLAERTVETLGNVYACHYPTKQLKTGRNVRLSPLHDRLAAAGAEFVDVSGWESPAFYWSKESVAANGGAKPTPDLGWDLRKLNIFEHWQREHEAARNGVVLMDLSFFCKFELRGPDAGTTLNFLCNNNVAGPNQTGKITYTQMLTPDGCVAFDLTVVKVAEDDFFLFVTDTMYGQFKHHWSRYAPAHMLDRLRDVTAAFAMLNIQGPRSRELIQAVVPDTDFSNAAYPFRRAQRVNVGFASALCTRITYMGELGYELTVPVEQAVPVYDAIVEKGKDLGLVHAGLRALGSARLEKGYRDPGHDVDHTVSVLDSGLDFCVAWKKKGGFVGKAALEKYRESAECNRMKICSVLCKDPGPFLYGSEPLLRDGQFAGYTLACSYGFSVGGAVGLAEVRLYDGCGFDKVTDEYLQSGKWQVEVGDTLYPIALSNRPFFDPDNSKIRR